MLTVFFGAHVCGEECETPRGCIEARKEKGRLARVQRAKAICNSCQVQDTCLEYAMVNFEQFGIWGGLTERERRNLRKAEKDKYGPDPYT